MDTLNAQDMIKTIEYLKSGLHEKRFKNEIDWFDNIIHLLQRGEKIEEELIQFFEKENPYPKDVFLPIPKEDFDKINDLLKKEMGYSIDRLSGDIGRKLYKSIIEEIKEVIK